jgi:release factor glutamine methyltransferase
VSHEADSVAGLLDDASTRIAATLGLDKRGARLEARVLAAFAWDVSPAWLIAHDTDPVSVAHLAQFQSLLTRRLEGVPIAYLVGTREFYGRPFQVSPAVLIPRPDTELLVEAALRHLPEHSPCRILDLGTGSGAVAVTLALQRPMADVVAVDTSAKALEIAQANARRLGAENVHCVNGNWYAELGVNKFDLIVSNPPYIAAADPHLDAGDLRFEPPQALASGDDGLRDLRIIVAGAPTHLAEHGWIFLEHGYDQAAAVIELLRQYGFEQICTLRDLAGLDRVSGGCWPKKVG